MKKYIIVGIFIIFSLIIYSLISENFDNTENKNFNKKDKQVTSAKNEHNEEEEMLVDENQNKFEIKKEDKIEEVLVENTQNIELVEDNIIAIDILEEIFSLRKGDKTNVPLQKEIAGLESTLLSKLQNESSTDVYGMFKKILHLEESNIEDKKYIIDFLEAIGTSESKILLVETYQNTEEEEIKEKISKLDTPEVYTLLALEANQNDDTDSYQLMMNKLEERTEEEVISGFMAFTKNDDSDSLDNITQLTEKWSNNNLSKQSAEITEDYLSRGDVKPRERIVAISILSNMEDREKRDRILTKALEHEDDEDVVNFIQTTLDSEN